MNEKSRLCCFRGPQTENQRKPKERPILALCQELRKLWNMRVTMIPIVIGTLGTVAKGLERR